MKRTPLRRYTPMRRTGRLPPTNPARRRESFDRNFGERGALVRAMPCLLARLGTCEGPVQAAHVKARGMGGRGGDRRQLVPFCGIHHLAMGTMGIRTFSARYQLDLPSTAERIAEQFDAGGVP